MDRIAMLNEILTENPKDAFARYGLAMEYSKQGDFDRALAEFSRLLHVPFGVNIYALRHSCRPLQDDPRFKEMIGNLQNNAPIL